MLLSIVAEYGQPISTTDLAQITEESLGATAHHVRAMVKDGLLDWAGERRARGALQTFYVISEEGSLALREPRIDALLTLFGAFVTRQNGKLKLVSRLDHQAGEELVAVIERLKPEVQAIVDAATQRSTGPTG